MKELSHILLGIGLGICIAGMISVFKEPNIEHLKVGDRVKYSHKDDFYSLCTDMEIIGLHKVNNIDYAWVLIKNCNTVNVFLDVEAFDIFNSKELIKSK